MVSLLSLVEAAEGLVNGINLSIKGLLIGAKVKATASPPTRGLLGACCPNLSTVEAGTVCPDRVLSCPGPPIRSAGDLKCLGPAVYGNIPRKGQAPAPLLALYRIPRLEGCRRSQSCCKCCSSLSLEDFLGPLTVPWSSIESLGESGLAMVQQCSGRYKATLRRNHSEGGRPVCLGVDSVCYLLFLSCYLRPRGPWQQRSCCRSNSDLLLQNDATGLPATPVIASSCCIRDLSLPRGALFRQGFLFVQSFILYPASCGPKGHGNGSAAALRQSTVVKYIFPIPIPGRHPSTQPQNPAVILGLLCLLFSPIPPEGV